MNYRNHSHPARRIATLTMMSIAIATAFEPCNAQILIGQSASLTGSSAEHSRQFVEGARACFETTNRRGGVQGQPIHLKTIDDKGSALLAREITEQLVSEGNVTALFGYTTRPTSEAGLAVAEKSHVVFFAPASGGETLRNDADRFAFHVRPGYATEYRKIIDTLATAGVTSFAVVVNADDLSDSNAKAVSIALARRGLALKTIAKVPRDVVDISRAADLLIQADAAVLVVAASGKSVAPLLVALRQAGYRGKFATMSLVGATLPGELGAYAPGLIVTNIVPNPKNLANPLTRQAARDLHEVSPASGLTFSSLEGYASACSLVEVLRRTHGLLRGDALAKAIEGMPDLRIVGDGLRLTFAPSKHTGSNFVDVTIVGTSGKLIY